MSGRLSQLRRRRDTPPAGPPDPGSPAGVPPAAGPAALPADVLPGADTGPGFRDRGRLRRRLRYLRRVRELGFRDIGGLVFDLHRFGRTGDDLVRGKLAALEAVDRELRALERALDDERDFTDLHEPGIAACPRCGALHGSDARFCPACGVNLHGPTTIGELPVPAGAAAAPRPAPPPPGPIPDEPAVVTPPADGDAPAPGRA